MRSLGWAVRRVCVVGALVAVATGCAGSPDDTVPGKPGDPVDTVDADAERGAIFSVVPQTATAAGRGGCRNEVNNGAAAASHVPQGTPITYGGLPPVSGTHWSQWPELTARVYPVDERPELAELVHSQEHGWTLVWYDSTVAEDSAALSALESAADQAVQAHSAKVVFVPWAAKDGEPLPDGAHVALTHWGARAGGQEYRQFCSQPDAAAVLAFAERHPRTDAFEPHGP